MVGMVAMTSSMRSALWNRSRTPRTLSCACASAASGHLSIRLVHEHQHDPSSLCWQQRSEACHWSRLQMNGFRTLAPAMSEWTLRHNSGTIKKHKAILSPSEISRPAVSRSAGGPMAARTISIPLPVLPFAQPGSNLSPSRSFWQRKRAPESMRCQLGGCRPK